MGWLEGALRQHAGRRRGARNRVRGRPHPGRASAGIGKIDDAAWKQTVDIALGTKNETGATIITKQPPESAKTNEFVDKALAELQTEGADVDGKGFKPITVELKEGGN